MRKNFGKFFLSFLFFTLLAHFTFSQSARELEINYPEFFGIKPTTIKFPLEEYLKYIYNFAILVAGLLMFASLIVGGIKYLTAYGNVVQMKDARTQISSGFFGIVILLVSYLVLTTINPQLAIFESPKLSWEGFEKKEEEITLTKEEISAIYLEIPYGQAIKNGVWKEERRKDIEKLTKENEEFFQEEIKVNDQSFNRISDLNKYLKSLTEECLCERLQGLCADERSLCRSLGCFGDPCQKENRKIMNKILEINQKKIKKILEFQEKIKKEWGNLKRDFTIFVDVENDLIASQQKFRSLLTLAEFLKARNSLEEGGIQIKKTKIPNAPPPKDDPLTFYSLTSGTILDYPYLSKEEIPEIPSSLALPEITGKEEEIGRISCPAEIPVGEIMDQLRKFASLMIFDLERLTHLYQELGSNLEKMNELTSECNNKNCKIYCVCVPNPAIIVNPAAPPCIGCLGGGGSCMGEVCPRKEIEETTNKIKEIEDEIFLTLKEIKEILPQVVSFLIGEEPWNLEKIKEEFRTCQNLVAESFETEKVNWLILNCQDAIGNYGPGGGIIEICHPRNFFCCSPTQLEFPGEIVPKPKKFFWRIPEEKYQPLETDNNCPKGWDCEDDVRIYNQYNDASDDLKEFLACMRDVLDRIQKERELKKPIGRISSISDSKIYKGTCDWETGPKVVGGCSHTYGIKYGKERVSAHYGGPNCRYEEKSYAVDFGDEENFKYIEEAAKTCDPGAYVKQEVDPKKKSKTDQEKPDHIHISITKAHIKCGAY